MGYRRNPQCPQNAPRGPQTPRPPDRDQMSWRAGALLGPPERPRKNPRPRQALQETPKTLRPQIAAG
eukprot:5381025-Pyramimonas_sp.AAC.1